MEMTVKLGTRASRLALVQTETVASLLAASFPAIDIPVVRVTTEGDADRTTPLADFGGRGAFVRSIENALLEMRVDAAVHSLKDLPSGLPEGLILAATPERIDPRDALVARDGACLRELPEGSIVGTGSERRSSQLAEVRPGLVFRGIRGNVETRLRKLDDGEYDAVILAAAGLVRLDLASRITEYLDVDDVLPAPCQGIIGIECRQHDDETEEIIRTIDNGDIRRCAETERAFIRTLGMGCHAPVGAYATIEGSDILFRAFVMPEGGSTPLKETISAAGDVIIPAAERLARKFRNKL